MSLKERLIEQIRRDGPMPFEEFQAIALYDPDDGFFGSGKLRSVKEGDFLTSPEVSPLFGESLGRFVEQVISPPGSPAEDVGIISPPSEAAGPSVGGSTPKGGGGPGLPVLVEAGAGSGSLLEPLLAAVDTPVDPWAVEASPAARRSLEQILPAGHVIDSLDAIPTPFTGVIIANELLDNFPVALAVRTEGGWEERWVGVQDDELVLVPHDARPEVATWADRFGLPCPIGGQVEVQLTAGEWLSDVLDRLAAGTIVLIDYGDLARNLERRRAEGTLRTYRGHHLGPDPLLEPGETDITVDVNFTALLAVAEEAGATAELLRQDEFLSSLGLRDRVHELQELEWERARAGDTMGQLKARSDRTNAETLLHPRGLGDFRVLVVYR